ncbi:glycine-rich selenoprotein-like [Cimex lectularius]|uniref:Glycine-rich selenoprotein n=1 Tax=Cimex lectularius TaxID=79782 RepID=A0A8I6RIX2_CIMLE|nr:glycine-rich selenoprotein-like [Cimex lectularius]
MAYVTRDGTVTESMPWGVAKLVVIFWGVINLITAFFQTLIPGFTDDRSSNRSNFRSGGGGRGGGGGSGGWGGWGNGPRGPRPGGRPSGGNIHGLGSVQSPPSCGSCCGL